MSKTPVPPDLRDQVFADARGRCGYCLSQQCYLSVPLEIDHLKPESGGGQTRRGNLWLACSMCNKRKSGRVRVPVPGTQRIVRLFNPRRAKWTKHFRWVDQGERIEGISDVGRATVAALELNHPIHVEARRNWISVGWHPPED
jgi:5-methylcytosine-specific restriction endonuclease McrA